jgi:hydroxyacyl-ACP dehydratase HTD2-like protein with hotdog domain
VQLFCRAIGETDPVYLDEVAAHAAGHRTCPVPPTFIKALESEHFSSAALMQLVGIPLNTVLHAQQQFTHHASIHVGDVVTLHRQITDAYDKRAGELSFVVIDTHYDVGEQRMATSRQTILSRRPVAVDTRSSA